MKIPGGYYIKARQIKDSAIAHAPPYVRELWDYILREANHKDVKYSGFTVLRGQLFRSYKEIREDLCWYVGYRKEKYNENHMKMGMRHLMKQLMITSTKQPRGNIITVCNYDYFQNPKNYEATNETTNETTNGQPRDNQGVLSINKNDKNVKNDKNKNYSQTSDEVQLSELLFNTIKDRNPNHKKPNIQKWARDIDLLIRIDKKSSIEIRAIIDWCQKDSFWQNNILSTKKLRNKFDQLFLKMKGDGNGQSYKGSTREVGRETGRAKSDGEPYILDGEY